MIFYSLEEAILDEIVFFIFRVLIIHLIFPMIVNSSHSLFAVEVRSIDVLDFSIFILFLKSISLHLDE